MTLLMMPGVRMELGAPWGAGTPPNPITSPTSPYALLVAGGSLLLAIILCFAIGMR